MSNIGFATTHAFDKEFKKLKKRFRTLSADLEQAKKVIKRFPIGEEARHAHILKVTPDRKIFVIKRRLASQSTKHNDFRLVYVYDTRTNTVTFVEIYYKGMQSNHNVKRVEEVWREVTERS